MGSVPRTLISPLVSGEEKNWNVDSKELGELRVWWRRGCGGS